VYFLLFPPTFSQQQFKGMENILSLAKRSEKGLLTPDNCVVALIDYQPQMLFGVTSIDRQSLIRCGHQPVITEARYSSRAEQFQIGGCLPQLA